MLKKFFMSPAVYVGAWILLVLISLPQWLAVLQGRECFFQTSWLSCVADLPAFARALTMFGAIVLIGLLAWGGWMLWRGYARNETLSSWRWWMIAVILACAVFTVPFGSSDTSYYFSAGKAFNAGLNPYVEPWVVRKPFWFPISESTITGFSYGPLMASLFRGVAWLSGNNEVVFLLLWKLLMVMVVGCLGFLLTIILKRIEAERKALLLFFLAQPLLLFEWVVNGHFDGLWLLTVLAAIWAGQTKRWWLVLPVLCVGTWIKFVPFLIMPFFVLWWWQELRKDSLRRPLLEMMGGGLLALGITVISWWPYWTGTEVFASVVVQSKWAVMSVFSVVYYSLQPLFEWLFAAQGHWYLTRLTQGGLLAIFLYLLYPLLKQCVLIVLRRVRLDSRAYVWLIVLFLLVYLMVWQKSFLPWYGTWFIPLALIAYAWLGYKRIIQIARWLAVAPFIYYIVWLPNWLYRRADGGSELWFYYVIVAVVIAYPLYLLVRWRGTEYSLEAQNESAPHV